MFFSHIQSLGWGLNLSTVNVVISPGSVLALTVVALACCNDFIAAAQVTEEGKS